MPLCRKCIGDVLCIEKVNVMMSQINCGQLHDMHYDGHMEEHKRFIRYLDMKNA